MENGLTSDRQEVFVEIKGDFLVLKANFFCKSFFLQANLFLQVNFFCKPIFLQANFFCKPIYFASQSFFASQFFCKPILHDIFPDTIAGNEKKNEERFEKSKLPIS